MWWFEKFKDWAISNQVPKSNRYGKGSTTKYPSSLGSGGQPYRGVEDIVSTSSES